MGANATTPPPAFYHPAPLVGDSVFNGNSPNPSAWTALDISAWVGARVVLAYLLVLNTETAPQSPAGYAFRRDRGVANREARAQGFPTACDGVLNCYVQNETANGQGCVLVQTDENGVFEWYCDQVDHLTQLGLMAWLPIRDVG